MIGAVAGRLAAHLGAGALVFAAGLSLAYPLPAGFLRFCSLTAGFLASASVFLAGDRAGLVARAATAALAFSWFAALRLEKRGASLFASLALPAALAALATEPCAAGARALCAAGSASSALLLGSTAVSMILGHWYLVDPKLAITPLKAGAFGFALAAVARPLVVLWSVLGEGHSALRLTSGADLVYSTPALFFLFRALTGLGGPLLLAGLIWQTVRMRSTQSATGLLYVALILVLFGELISQFLTITTGLPL